MKKFLSVILALLMVATMLPMAILPASAASTPTPYDGVPVTPQKISSGNYVKFGLTADNWSSYNGYYGIRTAAELYGFAALVNGSKNVRNAVLLQDIVVNETVSASGAAYSWTPIGNPDKPYLGTFDGNGYTISGIYINGSGDNVGLFGVAGYCTNVPAEGTAVIKNVILSDSYIKGNQNVAGIVGRLSGDYVTVSKCKVDSSVSVYATHASDPYVGGITGGFGQALFGVSSVCTVADCVSFATVKAVNADDSVGAVIGYWRTTENAMERVVCNNCYYLAGCATDKNGAVMDGTGGYSDIHNWCTALSFVSDSHTCVSADHREVKATCQYPGRAAYSECLICGKVTSGEKTDYAIADHSFTVATCTTPATCIYCGLTGGSKDASNHTSVGTAYQLNGTDDKKHDQYHTCCKAIIKTEKHSFSGTTCTVCNYKCTHSKMESGVCPNCGLRGTPYLKPVWNEKTKTVENSVELTGSEPKTFVDSDTLTDGWYIVNGNQSISTFYTSGTVNLVLADGAHLEVKARVMVESGSTLNIYAQSNDPSVMGKMTATSSSFNMSAAIGGDAYDEAGTINIYGGMISADTKGDGAAIGRGYSGWEGDLTVHGGIVTASSISVDSMTVNGGIVLSASTDGEVNETNGLYFNGANGVLCGDLYTLPHDWTLPAGKTLTINEGETLIVPAGLTLTIEGSIINNGTIQRYGTVICKSGHGYSGDCDESCNNCGEARNSDTAHSWVEATCSTAKTCTTCGLIEGEALGHNMVNGVCIVCRLDENGAHHIYTADQLMDFAVIVNEGYKDADAILEADIDLDGYTWTPIGVTAMGEGVTNGYTGHFDGNGHVIRNVTFATPASAMAAGIFGTVQNGGTVRNLGVENLSFDDNTYDHRAGGIAGQLLADSTISDCYVRNSTVKASSRVVGGIVGMNYGTVKNCYTCNMTLAGFNNRFGGISGDFSAGKLENCYTDYSALASSQAGTTANCKAGVSADVFASGEIAYLLSGSTSEGDLVWGQLIGTDSYPVFGGETVYYNETNGYYNILHTCDFSGEWKYDAQKHWKECTADSCSEISEEADHSFTDGKCDCGYECTHENETGDTCSVCGATIKFATITGVSINVDGVIYTSDNTSAENPAVILPDSVVTFTVTGENFHLLSADPGNAMIGFTYFGNNIQGLYNNPSKFDIDTVNNTVSFLANYDVLPQATTASELTYTNDGWNTDIGSGVYVIYIDKKDIADTLITLDNTEFIYSGYPIEPTVLVMADGQTLMADEHYTLTFESNVNAGTASVTVKGIGDYTGEVTKEFTITKAYYNLTAPTPDTLTYNGDNQYLVSAGTVEGAVFEYSLDGARWSTSIPQAKDVGNYTVYYRVLADENHYGIEGTVDVTIKECPHNYGEGVLTRPERITTTEWDDGFYTYTCSACNHYYQETVKRADYAAYDAVSDDYYAIIMNSSVLGSVKDALKDAVDSLYQNHADVMAGDRIESEQEAVDKVVAEFEKLVSDAEEKIASDEYVKADYTAIDEAIADIEQKFVDENVTDEAKAGLDEIKTQLEAMKADENTSKADLAELEKALGDYEAELDKGIEDGTLVKFSGERVFLAFVEEAEKKIDEQFGENAFYDFANENRDSFYNLYDKYFFRAAALEGGTMAENAENVEYIKGMVDELFGMVANCLDGTHNYGEGELTRPTFESKGYYTYTCTLCGHSYTVPTEKADDTALYDASMKVMEYIDNNTLTQEAKDEIYKSYRDILKNNRNVFDELGFVRGDLIEEDQPVIDTVTEALQKIIADADEKIASGEYVKIDGMKEYNKIADALDAELMENYSQEEFAALAEKAGDEINARFGEIIEKAEALTGTVAENKDALAEIESEMRALYGEIKNCLDGVHNGFVYEVTEEAKCEVNAIESATCTLCGETDEREVEGTALTHSFTKYEETEAPKCGVAGKEISYCDNGCGATDEKEIAALEHIFLDYVSNGDATCTADGTKTAECANGCGKKDTVEDEGSMLDHVDEDGDDLCDECGDDMHVSVEDCECTCHRKDVLNQFFYKIIQLIRKLFGINSTCECGTVHTSGLTPIWKIIVLK